MKFHRTVGALLLLASFSVRGQTVALTSIAGIWQDVADPGKYYSLHVNRKQLVLIDLPGIGQNGATLTSSFLGKLTLTDGGVGQARLTVLEQAELMPTGATLFFSSSNDAYVSWGCAPGYDCTTEVRQLRKVF